MLDDLSGSFFKELGQLLTEPNMLRSMMILIISMIMAYWLSRFLAKGIIAIAQVVARRGDNETDDQRNLRYRQTETYLSIAVAVIRVVVVGVTGYVMWRMLSPIAAESQAANGLAAIGAGAFFVVIAGQTLGIVLRDLTAGTAMIAEGWFHVGDYVKFEPYMDVEGVVERFTLRSTRVRAVNGEIIWLNNQSITGVHVTPRGVVTMSVEVFIRDKEKGIKALQDIIDAMPKGKTMLARPLKIDEIEKWTKDSWHITITGQTLPRRAWLIEDYFIKAVEAIDNDQTDKNKLLLMPPLVHMSDPTANKRLNRAVRVQQSK